ncbi:MAG: MarR family winged helix-turn-helix transcriptional regulator [Actinomycetota bacterium]
MDQDRARTKMLALLPAVADAIRREADKISRANFCDCNIGDVYMIATIQVDHGGSARPSDLIGSTYTTSAGVTGSLKRLEAAGYIERQRTPHDGRVSLAVVTDAGRKTVETALPAFSDLAAAVTGGLDDDEVERLTSLAEQYLETTVED